MVGTQSWKPWVYIRWEGYTFDIWFGVDSSTDDEFGVDSSTDDRNSYP